MSDKPDDGGPAFPVVPPLDSMGNSASQYPYPASGMTLRDYFAAKAMQAAIAHHGLYDEEQPMAATSSATALDYHAEFVAKIAYTYADAMLAARKT